MPHKVPIPTDNIYKFYALFGLALLLACLLAFVSVYNTHLDRAFDVYQELETLKKVAQPNQAQKVRLEVLERMSEILPANKEFYMSVISATIGLCITLIGFGFYQWQFKVQPLQDKLLAKQIEKVELEIKALNKKINYAPFRRRTH